MSSGKWERGLNQDNISKQYKNKKNKKNNNNNNDDRRNNDRRNNDRRNNDRRNNNRRNNDRNNDRNNKYVKDKEDVVIPLKPQILQPQIEEKKYEPIDTKWKGIVNNTIESEYKPEVDVKDPKYWNGYIWIGPVFRKMNKPSHNYNNYLKQATKYASTIVMPFEKIQYSRDNCNWYNSYKETFTEYEWNNMENQKYNEVLDNFSKKMEDKYNKELEEAYQEYYETGNMNTMVQVDIESKEFDKYLEKLENEYIEAENDFDEEEEEEY